MTRALIWQPGYVKSSKTGRRVCDLVNTLAHSLQFPRTPLAWLSTKWKYPALTADWSAECVCVNVLETSVDTSVGATGGREKVLGLVTWCHGRGIGQMLQLSDHLFIFLYRIVSVIGTKYICALLFTDRNKSSAIDQDFSDNDSAVFISSVGVLNTHWAAVSLWFLICRRIYWNGLLTAGPAEEVGGWGHLLTLNFRLIQRI